MALSKIRSDSLEDTAIHGNRNLTINGAMQIFQRATAATAATGYSTADRWWIGETTDGAYTSEKSTDNPFETGSSLKLQVTTADTSLGTTQVARFFQRIEGQNLQHLLYGTSSAKTLTLSFWVKSNKTGTYSILLRKVDTTPYHFIHSYTISNANTWEKKVITITPTAGSTSFITASAGTIDNDNDYGFELAFNLAQGSQYAIGTSNTWSSDTNTYGLNGQVNWMDSTSNNFYLTEVQLEVGSEPTPFEHEDYSTTLRKCQRYYFRTTGSSTGYGNLATVSRIGNTLYRGIVEFPVTMRSRPSFSSSGSFQTLDSGFTFSSISGGDGASFDSHGVQVTMTSNGSAGQSTLLRQAADASAALIYDAEL